MKKIRVRLPIRINAVIQNVLFTNSASHIGLGLVINFLPLFIVQDIKGGNIAVAGIIASVSPIIQGAAQLGAGPMLDKLTSKNERWPFYFFIGRQFTDVVYLLFLALVSLPWQLYLLQAVRGIAGGVSMPSGNIIQGKYIDRGKEGTEWAISGGMMLIFYGIGTLLAGIIIAAFGFKVTFLIGAMFLFIATLFAIKTLLAYNKAQRTQNK